MFSAHAARTLVAVGIVAAVGATLAPAPASARVVVGFGFGLPVYAPPPRIYYPPAPVYYVPPPPPPAYYYAPAPAAAVAPPASAPAPSSADCRPYNSTTVIDGTPQQITGTACRQPDGSWRIVN
ncbi:MAG TPA: hypothetical protein VLV50_09160 [Stellaceae bacterium]|nr:hypothetical protein [Stellaceae bacterium]